VRPGCPGLWTQVGWAQAAPWSRVDGQRRGNPWAVGEEYSLRKLQGVGAAERRVQAVFIRRAEDS